MQLPADTPVAQQELLWSPEFCCTVEAFREDQEGLRVASNWESLHHLLLSEEQLMWRCITVSSKAPASDRTLHYFIYSTFRGHFTESAASHGAASLHGPGEMAFGESSFF